MQKRHGMKGTPTYTSWIEMRRRCRDSTRSDFANYGGRGIQVCAAWDSFEQFLADMGVRPEGTTLDRVDVEGDYTPDNCQWSTAKQQLRNTRVNRLLTYQGRTQCLAAWAEEFGISAATLQSRLRAGYTLEQAVKEPVRVGRPGVAHCQTLITCKGKTRNLKDWCRHLNLGYHAVHRRIKKQGMSFEEAITRPFRKSPTPK